MKKLIVCISGSLLLALHANAQITGVGRDMKPPTPPIAPKVSSSLTGKSLHSSSGTVTVVTGGVSKHQAFTYNGVGNATTIVSRTAPPSIGVESITENIQAYGDVQEQGDGPVKTKTFSKSFAIDRNDKILLDNIYGSITVKTWNKNEIKVDAEIKAYAMSEDEAQKLLDNVSIVATKSGDLVSYKTTMQDRSGSWGSSTKNGKTVWRRETKVYYTVYMPSSNNLKASQQYGNLQLEDFAGPTSLKVAYGNLTAGNLSNTINDINVQYGRSNIEKVNEAKVRHQYGSGVNIGGANDLEMDVQYAGVILGPVKNNLNLKIQYGPGANIASAGSLNLTAQYTKVRLDKLSGNFTGKLEYGGGLSVSALEPGCKIFNCDAEYAGVTIGFTPGYSGTAHINTQYGSFRYPSDVTVKRIGENDERNWSTEKSYTAQIGKGGTNNIQINTRYQGVTFK